MAEPPIYSLPGFSEPVSSLSHLLGAGIFTCLTPRLLLKGRGSPTRLASLAVFAFSVVLLLSMSGVYHLLPLQGAARVVLLRLDHGAIFVLIAGTFTPLHVIVFRGAERWAPLMLIWLAAVAGVTLKSVFFSDVAEWVGLTLYLAMGWAGAYAGVTLWRRRGFAFVRSLVWGGVAYSIGGVIDFLQWPNPVPGVVGPHELFHVGVLTGAALHWHFVTGFADGLPPVPPGGNLDGRDPSAG